MPTIALHLNRDGINPTYTTGDPILGHVVIEPKVPLGVSQITITLSGLSILRNHDNKTSQYHKVSLRILS